MKTVRNKNISALSFSDYSLSKPIILIFSWQNYYIFLTTNKKQQNKLQIIFFLSSFLTPIAWPLE